MIGADHHARAADPANKLMRAMLADVIKGADFILTGLNPNCSPFIFLMKTEILLRI